MKFIGIEPLTCVVMGVVVGELIKQLSTVANAGVVDVAVNPIGSTKDRISRTAIKGLNSKTNFFILL